MHVPAPTSFEPRRIIAKTVSGAGYDSTFVLLNTTDTFMSGMLAIGGGDVAYTIAARGVFVHEVPDNGEARVTGHAVVKPKSGATPVLSSIVSARRPDGTLRTAALWQSVEGTHFWAPVSTYPTMLRHGKIQYELDIVNEGPVPATVYLDHFDVDGMRRGRFERTLPIGTKAVLDLEHIFAVGRLRGSLRVFSDSDVALTLLKKVTNVRGELVFNDVPLQEAPEGNTRTLTFATKRERRGPRFLDRKPSRSERDVRLALLNGIRARTAVNRSAHHNPIMLLKDSPTRPCRTGWSSAKASQPRWWTVTRVPCSTDSTRISTSVRSSGFKSRARISNTTRSFGSHARTLPCSKESSDASS